MRMGDAITIVTVVNFPLPATDYRASCGRLSPDIRMIYALPLKPDGVDDADFVEVRLGEGFRLQELWALFGLGRWLRRHRNEIDVVHFFSTKLILLGPLLARMAGLDSLVTVTGYGRLFNEDGPAHAVLRSVYVAVLGVSFRLARAALFQNHGDMRWAIARVSGAAGKAVYVGSAVDAPVVVRGSDFHQGMPVVVLLVSRLLPSKGIEDFLWVARQLHHRGISFSLVGPASTDYPDLARRVIQAHREGVLTYKSYEPSVKLARWYREADIFLFPSYGEGMARVMLEAGFAGLQPVAYDINANHDLIVEGSGTLVAVGDRDALTCAVEQIARDRTSLAAAAHRYQERVVAAFGIESYERRFLEVVYRLMTQDTKVRWRS